MKITIDTKDDSHDEIRKVIDILTNLVGSSNENIITNSTEVEKDIEESNSNAFTDMFSSDSKSSVINNSDEEKKETTINPIAEDKETEIIIQKPKENKEADSEPEPIFANVFNSSEDDDKEEEKESEIDINVYGVERYFED